LEYCVRPTISNLGVASSHISSVWDKPFVGLCALSICPFGQRYCTSHKRTDYTVRYKFPTNGLSQTVEIWEDATCHTQTWLSSLLLAPDPAYGTVTSQSGARAPDIRYHRRYCSRHVKDYCRSSDDVTLKLSLWSYRYQR
jgi:hypothetical protein